MQQRDKKLIQKNNTGMPRFRLGCFVTITNYIMHFSANIVVSFFEIRLAAIVVT